jgi:hypothetical protein
MAISWTPSILRPWQRLAVSTNRTRAISRSSMSLVSCELAMVHAVQRSCREEEGEAEELENSEKFGHSGFLRYIL